MAKKPEDTQDIQQLVSAKTYELPIYILDGEEPYFTDLVCERMQTMIVPEVDRSFNQFISYGAEVRMQQLFGQARQYSMLGGRQLLLIKDADQIPDFYKEDVAKLLGAYLDAPQPTTCLVLALRGKSLDGNKPLTKRLKETPYHFRSQCLKDAQVAGWIQNQLKTEGLSFDATVPQVLEVLCGNDLAKLANEISKLSIVAKQGGRLDADTVYANVGVSRDYNVFALQAALFAQQLDKAYQIVSNFAQNPKEHPIVKEGAVLAGAFTRLVSYQHAKSTGVGDISAETGINNYFMRDYEAAARNFSLDQSIAVIQLFSEVDALSKGINALGETIQMDQKDVWQHFIIKFIAICR